MMFPKVDPITNGIWCRRAPPSKIYFTCFGIKGSFLLMLLQTASAKLAFWGPLRRSCDSNRVGGYVLKASSRLLFPARVSLCKSKWGSTGTASPSTFTENFDAIVTAWSFCLNEKSYAFDPIILEMTWLPTILALSAFTEGWAWTLSAIFQRTALYSKGFLSSMNVLTKLVSF